jgi:L-alanine-DL-glutamate epimerase-like enolase superfamily enzyme
MLNWQLEPITLELKYTWKISRNSSNTKTNFVVHAHFGKWKGMGEVAPNIRYQETPENIAEGFDTFIKAGGNNVHDLIELESLLNSLLLPNALRYGIESAYIHMLCHAEKTSIFDFFGLKKITQTPTSFSLPIMELKEMEAFYMEYQLHRFSQIKLKVNSENMIDCIKSVSSFCNKPLMIDANESYTHPDDFLKDCRLLSKLQIEFMEQPFPAANADAYIYAKKHSPFLFMADESICANADFDLLSQQFDGINMKLMKAGGYLNGIRILNEAKNRNMKTMIGCMVETTLGISSAMYLCAGVDYVDLDGFLIVKNEPYKLLAENNGVLSIA